jgi:urocanate hydratase
MSASQTDTLKLFTALRLLQPSWAGSLVLGIGLNDAGRALALASLAAGAAALFLESDSSVLREAGREGCCTFTVTTLEEALRALKNEVRQGRAITVGLGGDGGRWLAEMVERGVLPQYVAVSTAPVGEAASALSQLSAWGAKPLSGMGLAQLPDGIDLDGLLVPVSSEGWTIKTHVATTLAERRAADSAMLAGIAGESTIDVLSKDWLRSTPSLFPRALDRAVWAAYKA